MNLSRAIHAANTAPPPRPEVAKWVQPPTQEDSDAAALDEELETIASNKEDTSSAVQEAYDVWRANRRAVIHTLDLAPGRAIHAMKRIRAFRRGMYVHNIDFHSGTIDEYLSKRLEQTEDPFLDHAILDLPGPNQYLGIIAKAMKPNGSLITFCPSITQINSVVLELSRKGSPFYLEKVLEIGSGVGGGGREWDVRPVKPRLLIKAETAARAQTETATAEAGNLEDAEVSPVTDSSAPETTEDSGAGWELICRPKVGARVVGGGFVGLWRRKKDY